MSAESNDYNIESEGYFGMSILGVNFHDAERISKRITNANKLESHLFYDEIAARYNEEASGMTFEGYAVSLSDPSYAIECLLLYAKAAHDLDAQYPQAS